MQAVVTEPIDPGPLVERVRTRECGAVVTFLGTVRARSDDGRAVDALSYEAYPPMALAEMESIAQEIVERYHPCHVAMVHRVGKLAVGETSVAIAVGAPHRAQAFDACEYAIDELKKRVEVWKKEHYEDGDERWLDGHCAHP